MKKGIKRITAFVLVMILSFASLISCSKDDGSESGKKVENITRGQWVTMLGEKFGMNTYKNGEPYYKDVASDSEIFPFVQACYEWGVLSTGTDTFKPDETATLGFAVTTSTLAANIDYSQYLENEENENAAIIKAANKANITNVKSDDEEELTDGIGEIEANVILNSAISAYHGLESKDVFDVEYKDAVVNATDKNIQEITSVGENKVSGTQAQNVEVGDILLMSANSEHPFGYTLKVTQKIQNADGTYTVITETPQINEVFDSIDIDKTIAATPENFILADGITLIEDNASAESSVYYMEDANQMALNDASHNINKTESVSENGSKKLKVKVEVGDGGLKPSVSYTEKRNNILELFAGAYAYDCDYEVLKYVIGKTDSLPTYEYFESGLSAIADYKAGKITHDQLAYQIDEKKKYYESQKNKGESNDKKYETGWSVEGEMSIDLAVDVKVDADFVIGIPVVEVNSFSVAVNTNVEKSLKVEGEIEKSIKIATFMIPIAGGLGIQGDVNIFFGVNGEIEYKVNVTNLVNYEYSNGNYRTTTQSEKSESIEAAVSLEGGVKVPLTLEFWGFDLAQVEPKISVKIESEKSISKDILVETNLSEGLIYYKDVANIEKSTHVYFPNISLNIGGDDTLLGLIGVDCDIDICSKDKNNVVDLLLHKHKFTVTLEILSVPIEEETTTVEQTTKAEEETTEKEESSLLSIDSFAVFVDEGGTATVSVTVPKGYTKNELVWKTEDSGIATVSNGVVTGRKSGSTVITVETKDGKHKASCSVTVN